MASTNLKASIGSLNGSWGAEWLSENNSCDQYVRLKIPLVLALACEKVNSLVNGLATPSYSVLEASSVPACVSTDFLSFWCWPRRHCRGELEYGLRREPFLGDLEYHCCKGFPVGWGGDETSNSTSAFLTTWWKSIEMQNMSWFEKTMSTGFLDQILMVFDVFWRERPLSHPGGWRFNSKLTYDPQYDPIQEVAGLFKTSPSSSWSMSNMGFRILNYFIIHCLIKINDIILFYLVNWNIRCENLFGLRDFSNW